MSNAPQFMTDRRLSLPAAGVRRRTGGARNLTVACILDDFSMASFAPEADFVPLTMRDWEVELITAQPDMLLVESAWRGHKQRWTNQVARCGPEIMAILEWCRERGVPTAFWNKEDPVHFMTFLTVAREFDAVFTTDVGSVPAYRAALGKDNVHFLPFAAQPTSHNPLELFHRIEGCAFAGAYYRKYPERTVDLERLTSALAADAPFHIYDRNFGHPESDYTFPQEYQQYIVGGLAPDEIDIAYKGYTSNLNLNSVKQSQSMFARRVYELMASNTLVISNFSRGVRTMFGDLLASTDSPAELTRWFEALDAEPNGRERLRVMATRKVMAEHTYAERLAFIASCLGLELAPPPTERVLFHAQCTSPQDVSSVLASCRRQTHQDWRLAIVTDDTSQLPDDPRIRLVAGPDDASQWAEEEGATHLACLKPASWYGPSYAADHLATLVWADVTAVGLVEHWAATEGGLVKRNAGESWKLLDRLVPTRSMVAVDDWTAARQIIAEPASRLEGLSTHPLGYCSNGADLGVAELATVLDLDRHTGASLTQLREFARGLAQPQVAESPYEFDLAALANNMPADADLKLVLGDQGQVELRSTLARGVHKYLYAPARKFSEHFDPASPTIHFQTGAGADVTLAIVFHDAAGKRLGHVMSANGRNTLLEPPEGTELFRLGLRVSGPGAAVIERIVGAGVDTPAQPVLTRSPHLVVTNIYPSYDNLYRNAFVHSRVRSYVEHGVTAEVMCIDERNPSVRFREFEGVSVTTCGSDGLRATLSSGGVENVLVHFLSPEMWEVLRDQPQLSSISIWVHGVEVQPWWRRAFNYTTDEQVEEAKAATEKRMAFWQEVLRTELPNVHFVFVSNYLAEQVFEDVGVELPAARYSVIHNPIDTDLFAYVPKDSQMARRVLSIRPYASPTYANDLSVAAILELKDRPGFEELSFTLCGDGPLWDETVAPLRDLPNVKLSRGFLTHPQIAELHREHGVFLVPTRADTQGVSRDEAMASGLVPVTSAVAAIPEFVDSQVAFLAESEDHSGLAEGIWQLAQEPDLFQRMSQDAARHTRSRTSHEVTIPQELALFLG